MAPVRTFVIFILWFVLITTIVWAPWARAEISSEEQRKRELFLRARENIEPAPAPAPTATPVRPQPRPRPTPAPEEKASRPIKLPPPKATPTPTPRATPEPERELPPLPEATPTPTPTPTPKSTPKPKSTPTPHPTPKSKVQEEDDEVLKLPPLPKQTPEERPTPEPRPTPEKKELEKPEKKEASKTKDAPSAPIVIEKSGLTEDEGLQPPPKPERRGFLGLGGGPRYRYLTRSVREAIDRAPVKRGRWQYVIVHNSGTRQGNAKIFHNYHKNVRKMENGLAYHFVIGNGSSSGNGEIEIGSRWTRQINGGHVASDYLNNIALGICLVGDYNRDLPKAAQLEALDELIRYLRNRVGKSKGKLVIIKAHREINPKPTDCPGDRFPYNWLHRRFK